MIFSLSSTLSITRHQVVKVARMAKLGIIYLTSKNRGLCLSVALLEIVRLMVPSICLCWYYTTLMVDSEENTGNLAYLGQIGTKQKCWV